MTVNEDTVQQFRQKSNANFTIFSQVYKEPNTDFIIWVNTPMLCIGLVL